MQSEVAAQAPALGTLHLHAVSPVAQVDSSAVSRHSAACVGEEAQNSGAFELSELWQFEPTAVSATHVQVVPLVQAAPVSESTHWWPVTHLSVLLPVQLAAAATLHIITPTVVSQVSPKLQSASAVHVVSTPTVHVQPLVIESSQFAPSASFKQVVPAAQIFIALLAAVLHVCPMRVFAVHVQEVSEVASQAAPRAPRQSLSGPQSRTDLVPDPSS